jgi:PQQ-dependent catabolism-associated CXXCW motif protein
MTGLRAAPVPILITVLNVILNSILNLGPAALACGGVRAQEARSEEASGNLSPPEPPGYRTDDYRAATPATLAGARVVTTAEVEALWQNKAAIFIDVLPRPQRPPNLPPGTIWRDPPRSNIPGSIWLPNTGYGRLLPATEEYLRTHVERVTGGDRTKLLVVYCLRDCWMSWNAAKRLAAMGYANVAWYPDGTDGWTDALLPVADAQPAPEQ